jgi:hypothetical protein
MVSKVTRVSRFSRVRKVSGSVTIAWHDIKKLYIAGGHAGDGSVFG